MESLSTGDPQVKPLAQRLYGAALGAIMKHLSDHGSGTISELAEISGVSRPTAQRALAELAQLGLVEESAQRPATSGRPARAWAPVVGTRTVLVADIQPARTRVQLSCLTGRAVAEHTIDHAALRADPTAADLPRRILEQVQALRAGSELATGSLVEAVIGVSGVVSSDGAVLLSSRVPELTGIPLAALAREVLGLEAVLVENDMNLRAVGELHSGVGQGASSFIYLTNHEFHRPAMVLDGALWHGAHRAAGERDILARTGLISPSLTHDGREVPYFAAAGLIESGQLGPEWIDVLNAQLAAVIAVLCYPLDPELVIVDGGPRTTGAEAITDLQSRLRALTPGLGSPRVVAGSHEEDLTLVGALTLALRGALVQALGISDPPLPARHRRAAPTR